MTFPPLSTRPIDALLSRHTPPLVRRPQIIGHSRLHEYDAVCIGGVWHVQLGGVAK